VTMMAEGNIHPSVATIAPVKPAILIPIKVAELMAIIILNQVPLIWIFNGLSKKLIVIFVP